MNKEKKKEKKSLYYKRGQVLQSAATSLQIGAGFTKWGEHYYNVGYLNVIKKWGKSY